MYHQKLAEKIQSYILYELSDSIYYSKLASIAPTKYAEEILVEISNDEKSHAESFKEAYYYITGKVYVPQIITDITVPSFKEALRIRLLAETSDYKKYGTDYIEAHNKYLENLFFMTKTMEARHAMKIPSLFEEIKA